MTSETTYREGDIVRLAEPGPGEADARFVLKELRGPRVLIELICDLRFPPSECVAIEDIKLEAQ